MKKIMIIFLSCVGTVMYAQQLTLDGILEKYYQAGNLAKLATVQTIVMSGTIVQQDLMPVKITRARPGRYLMEYDVADLTAYLAIDGNTAWFTAPWTGNAAPQPAPPDRTIDLQVRADIEGVLYDWKKKGHALELAGTDTVDGIPAYRIKVTRKDGGIEYNLISSKDFLPVKRISTRMMGGKEIPVETFYRDYRKVNEIPFPFAIETMYAGRDNETQLDSVILDAAVDPEIFKMPGK